MKHLCVFCGSQAGRNPQFRTVAEQFGRLLVEFDLGLVYGGGSVGLMGVIADAVLDAGGRVVGVIPDVLATEELIHPRATQMHIVSSMHARKAKMAELADGFIALPGGFGTFEEFFEVITWAQLGIHDKPIGLLNVAGYFDHLERMLDHAVNEGFIKPKYRRLVVVADAPELLLEKLLHQVQPPISPKLGLEDTYLQPDQTSRHTVLGDKHTSFVQSSLADD
jgi:uncharacterized protein (TIGR00730 family)